MLSSTQEITIHCPIDYVMELFKNQDYFKHWQRGLVSFENLSSSIGEVGSKRRMRIKAAGTVITMTEDITALDLPHLWEATYRTSGVLNRQCNRFRESEITINNTAQKVTLWESTSSFKFTGMMRLIGKTQPKLFTGQNRQHMEDFKTFAEAMYTNSWNEN